MIGFWLKDSYKITESQLYDESYDNKKPKSSKFLQTGVVSIENLVKEILIRSWELVVVFPWEMIFIFKSKNIL